VAANEVEIVDGLEQMLPVLSEEQSEELASGVTEINVLKTWAKRRAKAVHTTLPSNVTNFLSTHGIKSIPRKDATVLRAFSFWSTRKSAEITQNALAGYSVRHMAIWWSYMLRLSNLNH
jgi:hypothetical protein